nr:unnamed protein product [Callosobruchus chinensis]
MHLDHVYLSHLSWPSSRSDRSRRRNIRESVTRLLCSRDRRKIDAHRPGKVGKVRAEKPRKCVRERS